MEFTSIDRETAKAIRIAEQKLGYTSNNVGISIPFTWSGVEDGEDLAAGLLYEADCSTGPGLELDQDSAAQI